MDKGRQSAKANLFNTDFLSKRRWVMERTLHEESYRLVVRQRLCFPCNTLGDEDLERTVGSIGVGAGLPAGQFVSVGLGVVASSGSAGDCVWKRAGESVSGDAA